MKGLKYMFMFIICSLMINVSGCALSNEADGNGDRSKVNDSWAVTGSRKNITPRYTIEYLTTTPEYTLQYKNIWEKYTQIHPEVEIDVIGWTEGEDSMYEARIAAGDPPHIFDFDSSLPLSKDRYNFCENLLSINYPYWDLLKYDGRKSFENVWGVKDYAPCINALAPMRYSFCYYEDEMEKAGLNPRKTVRTMEDLTAFLKDLKKYVKGTNSRIQFVLDTGWHSYMWSKPILYGFTEALCGRQSQIDVWSGKISWDDTQNNPYYKTLEYFKMLYDEGILPEKWWLRQWEPDFESGFIARKGILTYHGSWIWDKVKFKDPDARLAGFTLPAYNDEMVLSETDSGDYGTAIFNAHKNEAIYPEIIKAFIWFNSPPIVKLRCEAVGSEANMNIGIENKPSLNSAFYQNVCKPFGEGFFGKAKWDTRLWGNQLISSLKIAGKPEVIDNDSMSVVWGDLMEGRISTEGFLKVCKERWEDAYKLYPKSPLN